MKEKNYWQEFLNSGRIEDYLSYKNKSLQSESLKDIVHSGEKQDAGACGTYRDDFKNSAYR